MSGSMRNHRQCRHTGVLTLILVLCRVSLSLAAPPADAAALEQFEKKVRPLLVQHCQECHGPEKPRGGLRLDSAAGLARGGDSGAAVVPGHPEASRLIQAVRQTGQLKMPPKTKLSDAQIADLVAWI